MSSLIEVNIAKVQQRIRDAEKKYQRKPHSVQLMAVSKTRTAAMIRKSSSAGISEVGENYLQEALDKQLELSDLALNWHFIGPIQSNKTREIAEHFDWVHSVDRLKIAQRLNDQRPRHLLPLNICLQVNISNEASKSGFSLEQLAPALENIRQLPRLKLRGLMAIPKASDDPRKQHSAFAKLKTVSDSLQPQFKTLLLDTLSMGMSNDLEAAIAEGATIVRIGTDIFGPRT
jgi:pyridoxal phosphate enzyme (YggS family)